MTSDKKLKVLFLPKWYPNYSDPLDGIFVVDHAKAVSTFSDVYLLFIHSNPNLKTRSKTTIEINEGMTVQITYFSYFRTRIRFIDQLHIGIKYLFVQFKEYRKIKKSWGKPNLIHVHVLLRPAFLAIFLKWFRRIPYLVTEHWSGYDPKVGYRISRLKKTLIKLILKNASLVTTVSEYAKFHLQRIEKQTRYEVVSNAVDEDLFKIQKKEFSPKKRLIHISTLDDYPKNFGQILQVISELAAVTDNFELYAIGKGVEAEKQKALAKDLELLDKVVFFLGYLPKHEVALHIAQSDLLLLFSHYETQSCVILESLLSGVPVVASAVGGVTELVHSDNGILVAPQNNDELYKACLLFLKGEITFSPEKIRSEATKYGYKYTAQRFAKFYNEIINNEKEN